MVEGNMFSWFWVFTEIEDPSHFSYIYDLDFNFTIRMLEICAVGSQVADTYSLATASQLRSGESARSRIGKVQRVSILSKRKVSSEYAQTLPSSEPVTKKSF